MLEKRNDSVYKREIKLYFRASVSERFHCAGVCVAVLILKRRSLCV